MEQPCAVLHEATAVKEKALRSGWSSRSPSFLVGEERLSFIKHLLTQGELSTVAFSQMSP